MEITVDHMLTPHAGPCPDGGSRKSVYRVAGWCKPAWSVAGDFYDFIELPENKTAVFLGDVSGKGLSAAAVKTDVCTTIRSLTLRGASPQDVLHELNAELYARNASRFVTLIYILLDRRSHEMLLACAGHFPPLARNSCGDVYAVEIDSSLPIGVLGDTGYVTTTATLEPDQILCLYTDGVVEAMDEQRDQFGRDGLRDALAQSAPHPSAALKSIQHRIDEHVGAAPQNDDITLVCVGSARDAWCRSAG